MTFYLFSHPIFGSSEGLLIKYMADPTGAHVYLYDKLIPCRNLTPYYYTDEDRMVHLKDLTESQLTDFLDNRMRTFDELLPKVEQASIRLSTSQLSELL